MTTDEKIKATIRTKIVEEAGAPLGFATAQTFTGGQFTIAPPPLVVVVFEDGTVSLAVFADGAFSYKGRPQGPTPIQEPSIGREGTVEERERLDKQWDAALVKAHDLKRGDVVIVVYAKDARVELRMGPDFEAPAR